MLKPKTMAFAFLAGFIATLVCHQGVLHLLHIAGKVPMAGWNMTPVAPLGVPQVISLAFWGGLWGIVLWALIHKRRGGKHWLFALGLGALLPSFVAWFVVFPIKDIPLNGARIVFALLLNGAWGLGVAACMRLFGQRSR